MQPQGLRWITVILMMITSAVQAQVSLELSQLDKPLIVDGFLEPAWQYVDSVKNFVQIEPNPGDATSRRTVVRAAQFADTLFFSFECFIHDGDQIAARIQRRDLLDDSDDIISLLLDSYYDKRTSLLFQVNADAILTDAKVTNDGRNIDFLWDSEWDARTSIGKYKWVVEISIQLKNIQYNSGTDTWGINFGRVIRANQETVWWQPVTDNYRISQGGTLTQLQYGAKRGHNLTLFPYGTGRYEDSDLTGVRRKVRGDAGLDLRYQYGSNLVANMTLNPDFATVEGDKEQINLTPWELRFPDKRLFFQDGNEMFGTRISTFYSRRIGDMQYGGKVIGKAGKYQFNALFAKTEANDLAGDPQAWFNALRIKRDILNSSVVGLTYADRITDSTYVRSLSLDYVLNLGKTWKLTGQYVGSAPGNLKSHSAWFLRFARENNLYHYHIRYTNIGEDFRDQVNETGFIRDDDRHEIDSDLNYRFWFDRKLKYLYLSGKNNVFWSQAGTLRSWFLTYSTRMYWKNRMSFDLAINNEYKLFEKEFYNYFYQSEVGYNTDEATFVNAGYRAGRNFDRKFELWQLNMRVQLWQKLALTYELDYLSYKPDPSSNGTTIHVLGADYFFQKNLWIRIFTQKNSITNKFYFYGLFGWRFKPPFGAAYLIVNTDRFDDVLQRELRRSKIIFLKFTYPLTVL